jgi:hypothetical protein
MSTWSTSTTPSGSRRIRAALPFLRIHPDRTNPPRLAQWSYHDDADSPTTQPRALSSFKPCFPFSENPRVTTTTSAAYLARSGQPKTRDAVRLPRIHGFARSVQQQVRAGEITDLEGASLIVDFTAGFHANTETRSGMIGGNSVVVDDIDGFVGDLNAVFTGRAHDGRFSVAFGSSGFASNLQDGSNQVRHFTGALVAGYEYGFFGANAAAFAREMMVIGRPAFSMADLRLNALGVAAGDRLTSGNMRASELGGWMRNNPGP